MSEKTYEINGKKYTQRPLVLGQIQQLTSVFKNMKIIAFTPQALILGLGEDISKALAVVLIPEGVRPREKDLAAIEADLFYATPEQALEVIEDFFVITPIASLMEKATGAISKISAPNPKATQ